MLSIVVNTFRRPATLKRCLEHLARDPSVPRELETIVVDDGGGDDLSELTRAFAPPPLRMRIVRAPHGGRAAARNRGVAEAHGRRILFLGDDVMVKPGCVGRHLACDYPYVATIGPYPWVGLRGSPPFRKWAEPNHQERIVDPENAGFLFFATGNLSMDRAAFLQLGGFDERFSLYGWEDIDLGYRFERHGGRLRYDARAAAVHEHPQMRPEDLLRREFEMGVTAWQYYVKWRAEPPAWRKMRFWKDADALTVPSPWRRRAGLAATRLLDALAPASSLNERVWERLIFSYRLEGVAEGRRRFGEGDAANGKSAA